MKIIKKHNKVAHYTRVDAILKEVANWISNGDKVLDVGCGDGLLSKKLTKLKNINIEGVETVKQPDSLIPIKLFDGKILPYPDKSFDKILLIDVLHHSRNPELLLKECSRVAHYVIIKDHCWRNFINLGFLYLSDYISNKPKGVDLPMNFIHRKNWEKLLKDCDLNLRVYDWNWKQKEYFDPVKHVFFFCVSKDR